MLGVKHPSATQQVNLQSKSVGVPENESLMPIRVVGSHYWAHRNDASGGPASVPADVGGDGGQVFEVEAAIDGAEMDRGRGGRCVALRGELRRILRDRFLPAEGKRD